MTKFRLKLKKTGKNTRPDSYDLNQILYEFTVEVVNRFRGLDLVNFVPEELWTEVHNIGGSEQNHHKKKEKQEGKVVI